MINKTTEMDLQHDFKEKNNKPESITTDFKNSKAIKEAKQVVKSRD